GAPRGGSGEPLGAAGLHRLRGPRPAHGGAFAVQPRAALEGLPADPAGRRRAGAARGRPVRRGTSRVVSLTHLVLLRHGQTEWNHTDRMQGQADVHLDATGVEQAHAAARALAARHFDAVYSSDLARAKATADTVAADLGLPVVVDPRLQEIHMGSWS